MWAYVDAIEWLELGKVGTKMEKGNELIQLNVWK